MKIILVAEHASIDFGGEAALPCHYFRVLLSRDIDVYLVVHERSKEFLEKHFYKYNDRIFYIPDGRLHRFLFACKKVFTSRISSMVFDFLLRILTQILQKRIVRKLIYKDATVIDISKTLVHQVIPVSPKEPSILYGLGVPIIFGPLNGGMHYPKGFEGHEGRLSLWFINVGRAISNPINYIFKGKREAAVIVVANERTKAALPRGLKGEVRMIVENGVDLSIWHPGSVAGVSDTPSFVYVGRLVAWKAVDILLDAFFNACEVYGEMSLHIIGDGEQRHILEKIVSQHSSSKGNVVFHGWIAQTDIAPFLVNSRALVLPSLYECGGAVVLEAMACSLAVIATNWGGPADYLDASCGVLVDPISRQNLVNGFSESIILLASNPNHAKEMGLCGRKKIEEKYDWEKKVDEVFDIYEQTIKRV